MVIIELGEKTYQACVCLLSAAGWTSHDRCGFLAALCEADSKASILFCLKQCINVVQPNLIRSIMCCVCGALSHTQHGPCLSSSAVVSGWGGFFGVGGCSCALSKLSETREAWLCFPINALSRHAVSSHTHWRHLAVFHYQQRFSKVE